LGAFTTGMIGFLKQDSSINNRYFYGVLVSVSIVLISLILLTSFWPAFLSGVWIYYGLAITALFPVIAVLVFWLKLNKTIVH
jgi:Na+(H+)/acetate symporter ActP